MAGRVSYYDERVARVWEMWLSMLERGYFIETPSSTTDLDSMTALVRADAENPLNREKAVMTLAPHFSASELPPAFASELDFFQFPGSTRASRKAKSPSYLAMSSLPPR